MKKTFPTLVALLLLIVFVVSCSLPPQSPVTRKQLMKTRVYNRYVLQESPEELLYGLNTRGEVIVEGYRRGYGKKFPIFIKLLALPGKIEVLAYDR